MARNICTVNGCTNFVNGRGLCPKHYYRWSKYGSPKLLSRTETGKPARFMNQLIDCNESTCVIWPFARNAQGYGLIGTKGQKRSQLVHRLVCETVNGPPKSTKLKATHSCGNGHLGCVNPKHLRWATQKQNMDDAKKHGTVARGARLPQTRLTEDQVLRIFALRDKYTRSKLGEMFGVTELHIGSIIRGERWSWLTKDCQ